jgi:hypothetical protein
MPTPWDNPSFPPQGDALEDMTYCAVGHVLSRWESVEVQLATLYSVFVEMPYELGAIKQYGDPRIFHERASQLGRAAEQRFMRHPNQAVEAEFRWLFDAAIGWSGRRNDVAHGIVEQAYKLSHYRPAYNEDGTIRYVLIPSFYMHRKRDPNYRPVYCYTSVEMNDFAAQIHELAFALEAFRCMHFPDADD